MPFKEPKPGEQHGPRPLDQVEAETGLSADYINEFAWALLLAQTPKRDTFLEKALARKQRHLAQKLVSTYEGRFPSDKFSNVVTDENKASVEQIDQIAAEVNQAFEAETLTLDQFLEADKQVMLIIFGSLPEEYQKAFEKIEQVKRKV